MKRFIWNIGEKVKISTEEPLYDAKIGRIDGKVGRLISVRNGIYLIRMKEGDVLIGRGLLYAPRWYAMLPSSEMSRLIANERSR
jgi:hypothetical protein